MTRAGVGVRAQSQELRDRRWLGASVDRVGVMSAVRVDADIDVISLADVMSLGTAEGPCVSMFMPTHRSGRET